MSYFASSPYMNDAGFGIAQVPIKNYALFALGVALIELAFGQPFEDLQTKADIIDSEKGVYTKYHAAHRFTRELTDEDYKSFASAIEFCIDPWLQLDGTRNRFLLENDPFRRQFYRNVVQNLQQEYQNCLSR